MDYVLWTVGLLAFMLIGGALLRPWYERSVAKRGGDSDTGLGPF